MHEVQWIDPRTVLNMAMKGRTPVTALRSKYQLSNLQAFMIMAVEIELGEECWVLYVGKLGSYFLSVL
jgi:hypothetical protein